MSQWEYIYVYLDDVIIPWELTQPCHGSKFYWILGYNTSLQRVQLSIISGSNGMAKNVN